MGFEDNADIEQDEECSENSYGDIDLLEENCGSENEEATFSNEQGTLPRPPTKPNVPIEDETICPVCNQPGKLKRNCKIKSILFIVNSNK